MRLIDIYFRAFKDYQENTIDNLDAQRARRVIRNANHRDDILTVLKYVCDIDDTWITKIEEGLVHVEKAISGERQFIRTEGEVVNIEKVKKTSKESIEHLSKNTNLISTLPKRGKMLIPDKLYIVEKLSDFAVYENRFLYSLLVYLKEFIHSRLEKIRNKVTSYQAKANINKVIKQNDRTTNYFLTLEEDYLNDPYLVNLYKKTPHVDRLEAIFYYTEALLKTSLMIEISKSPIIKPPIVKTNVLRMHPDFRVAMELYDFVSAYNVPGYKFTEISKTYTPFELKLGNEVAEAIELTRFILYKHGNDITDDLEFRFNKEQAKLEEQRIMQQKREISRLNKRVHELGLDFEQYILLLEKRNVELEKQNEELYLVKEENNKLKQTILDNEQEINLLNNHLEQAKLEILKLEEDIIILTNTHKEEIRLLNINHDKEINSLLSKHQEELDLLVSEHEKYISELIFEHNSLVIELKEEHTQTIYDLKQKHENLLIELKTNHKNILEDLRQVHEDSINLKNIDIKELKETVANNTNIFNDEISLYKESLKDADIKEKNALGLLYAYKQQQGMVLEQDNHTSKESFKELEQIKKSFNKYFNQQWNLTKKQIRDDVKEQSKLIQQEELENKKDKKK